MSAKKRTLNLPAWYLVGADLYVRPCDCSDHQGKEAKQLRHCFNSCGAMGNLYADQLAQALTDLWQPRPEPESFLHRLFELLGTVGELPSPLPPPLVASVKDMLTNRGPWEADIPVSVLSKALFRKLIVTSGHTAELEAIADALVIQIGAQRAVIPGMGHNVQNVGAPLNDLLEQFWLEKPVTQYQWL